MRLDPTQSPMVDDEHRFGTRIFFRPYLLSQDTRSPGVEHTTIPWKGGIDNTRLLETGTSLVLNHPWMSVLRSWTERKKG